MNAYCVFTEIFVINLLKITKAVKFSKPFFFSVTFILGLKHTDRQMYFLPSSNLYFLNNVPSSQFEFETSARSPSTKLYFFVNE